MGLLDVLKKNDRLRGIVKKYKNRREFLYDAKDFSEHYEEALEKKGDYRYRLMLIVHSLEKGMCRDDIRPFGREKVETVIEILKQNKRFI